jgi:Fe2+ transport system protein FeoA
VSSYTMSTGEENVLPLYELKQGESGEVVRLADACRGLTRRRFMDLGITPGVVVKNVLPNAFGGDPTAYFIRGSKIALRREQARDILVKKLQEESIYGS